MGKSYHFFVFLEVYGNRVGEVLIRRDYKSGKFIMVYEGKIFSGER